MCKDFEVHVKQGTKRLEKSKINLIKSISSIYIQCHFSIQAFVRGGVSLVYVSEILQLFCSQPHLQIHGLSVLTSECLHKAVLTVSG